ncbi:MAG TPA: Rne/Rng family ribonuclease [Nitrospirae bacterium]|nr:Rne/Rng family ribonuclease [Nitrospirota bacterium]
MESKTENITIENNQNTVNLEGKRTKKRRYWRGHYKKKKIANTFTEDTSSENQEQETTVETIKVEQIDSIEDNQQGQKTTPKRQRFKKNIKTEQTNSAQRDNTKRILLNTTYPIENRVAIVEGNILIDFYVESPTRQQLKGNIYKGVVVSILPSLQAAFVNFGQGKNGFLQLREIMPEIYQDKIKGKGRPSIQSILKKGDELLVQVDKDEHDNKGATLTTYISLAGRYIVMLPGQQRIGISRKIENRQDRDNLKAIFNSLKLPKNMGFILRTACSDSIETELNRDLKYLTKLWQVIKKYAETIKAPALVYKEHDLALKTVRDYLTSDTAEIIVDSKETFSSIKSYIKKITPGRAFNVIYHKDNKPLFSLYDIESQIDRLNEPVVTLPSKGYLIFNKTEALTAIDVNSGRSKKEDNIETTAFNTNLEAVNEIARQIRLRDIGGLIVIDFIDMQSSKNRKIIEQKMIELINTDKANIEITPLSKFCILEMTRERIRPSYAESTTIKCPNCLGSGIIKSANAIALSALREIHNKLFESNSSITCKASVDVANILTNLLRQEITNLEKSFGIRISVLADASLINSKYIINIEQINNL